MILGIWSDLSMDASSHPGTGEVRRPKVLRVALRVLIALEVLAMGMVGLAKFQGDRWVQMFEGWGYAGWFALVIGGVELLGALALAVPRVASYAATLLIAVMLGALWTVLSAANDTPRGPSGPLVHLGALTVILYARRGDRWRPGQARVGSPTEAIR